MNKKSLLLSSLLICGLDAAHAQFFGMNVNRDSIQKVTNADYADMIAKLGIAEPRPGRDPNNPDANRLPNYDELMANPFVHYPEALVTFDGRKSNDY